MPQDATIHDYAEYDTKARAEGIPKPTLHWLKDGKQIKVDDTNFNMQFGSASDLQVTSDFAIAHFGKNYEGTVSITMPCMSPLRSKSDFRFQCGFPFFVLVCCCSHEYCWRNNCQVPLGSIAKSTKLCS